MNPSQIPWTSHTPEFIRDIKSQPEAFEDLLEACEILECELEDIRFVTSDDEKSMYHFHALSGICFFEEMDNSEFQKSEYMGTYMIAHHMCGFSAIITSIQNINNSL